MGDWLVPDAVKFPGGMKAQADAIHAKGFKAGLWLAPFVCQVGSDIYENHKDWLYLHEGQPWFCGNNWGGCGCLWIIILIIILFSCCGNNGGSNCGCGGSDNCGCGC